MGCEGSRGENEATKVITVTLVQPMQQLEINFKHFLNLKVKIRRRSHILNKVHSNYLGCPVILDTHYPPLL